MFAITPSAKSGSLAGLDGYSEPVGYNGLTLALLNMAADLMPEGEFTPAALPADEPGFWSGPDRFGPRHRSQWRLVVAGRTAQGGTDTRTSGTAKDFRGDAGLVQLKVLAGGQWLDLLAARPIRFPSLEEGPAMVGATVRPRRSVPRRSSR